jgi:pimeloyl-ACP methyl ester carboxylesterase
VKPSVSQFLEIRHLRYHVRRWPAPGAPRMFLLHGWMDVSASFQFLVDALDKEWDVYAPDWRGYGLTDWGRSDCYWFPDYLADLDAILEELSPGTPVNLVGHSLGGNVGALYAGARPQRVARFANLEGFGMAPTLPEQAPKRYARWLDELREPPGLRPYASYAELADRLQAGNKRLSRDKAEFLARHWGEEEDGKVRLRSDPAHKIVNPVLYRYEEARACWAAVSAPVLWMEAAETETLQRISLTPAQVAERRAAFRDVRYATVADAGHMLHHDQPGAVARLLEEFLAR